VLIHAVPMLRAVSYLAPSLPESLFEAIAAWIARATGVEVALRFETATSGPPPDGVDPFSTAEADLGFLCAPTYGWLAARQPNPVELLAAPLFGDPRAAGKPLYFSEVVVRRGHPARRFADLREATWAYNDVCSLSGYLGLVERLGPSPARLVRAGTHIEALARVARGEVDAAAIDSNVLALALRRDPRLDGMLRIVETWGPYPVQPVVARATLDAPLRRAVREALLGAGDRLSAHGLAGFAPVSEQDYAG
jgi:phosphonate transport system substrate-binding protein